MIYTLILSLTKVGNFVSETLEGQHMKNPKKNFKNNHLKRVMLPLFGGVVLGLSGCASLDSAFAPPPEQYPLGMGLKNKSA